MRATPIPLMPLSRAFQARSWKTTGLGTCATLVDGVTAGFTIHGGKGSADDASMRVVWAQDGGDLFVEVDDDRLVGPGTSWVTDDHLELWLGQDFPGGCPDAAQARQWGIRVTDGRVFPAFGNPDTNPKVEIARAGNKVRVKISLPPADRERQKLVEPRVTLVYSDSDDGVSQERLIATSTLQHGKGWSLGSLHYVSRVTACVAEGGVLRPRMPLPRTPSESIANL
jgi:hypothetical protein